MDGIGDADPLIRDLGQGSLETHARRGFGRTFDVEGGAIGRAAQSDFRIIDAEDRCGGFSRRVPEDGQLRDEAPFRLFIAADPGVNGISAPQPALFQIDDADAFAELCFEVHLVQAGKLRHSDPPSREHRPALGYANRSNRPCGMTA